MSISLRSNADGSGTLLNGSTPVMEITAAGVVSLPNIAAGSSANQPVNLGQFTGANVSLSANGYQKLPSGLIIQWGLSTGLNTGTITFPLTFPNVCASVVSNCVTTNTNSEVVELGTISASSFVFYISSSGTSMRWFAIGY